MILYSQTSSRACKVGISKRSLVTRQTKTLSGFTILELIVVITITGIFMAIAAPSFHSMMVRNNLATITNTLVSTISFVRSEAIKRNEQIVIRRTTFPSPPKWGNGWYIFVDKNRNATTVSTPEWSDIVITQFSAISNNANYTAATAKALYRINSSSSFTYMIIFTPDGSPTKTGDFYVCSDSSSADYRRIHISLTGRVTLSNSTTPGNPTYATVCP